jgi:hypothetical protein
MREIVVDGVTFVAKSEPSDVKIVILQRGWVMVGLWSQDGEMCHLDNASVIRVWGTTKGLGELVSGPTSATKLDKAGHVEFHILTVVAMLDAEAEAWASLL